MLNQSTFVKESGVTRKVILVDELNSTALSCKVANTGMDADSDGKKIAKAGTPLYGSIENREAAFTTSSSATDPTATASVSGTGITAASVTASTFSSKVSGVSGTYEFTASVTGEPGSEVTTWSLAGDEVTLAQYGITPTGTAANGDKISVVFVAGTEAGSAVGILLHDVDVTSGTKNAQIVIFGFIDLNKLDTDVQALITSDVKSALKMIQFVR